MVRYTISQERKCFHCKGEGKYYVEDNAENPEPFSMNSSGYNYCSVCNGSGQILNEVSITEKEIEGLYNQMLKDQKDEK